MPDPDLSLEQKMFQQARRFESASNHLASGSFAHVHAYPSLHNAIVSMELYLKALQQLSSGSYQRGHNLENLFQNLQPQIRAKIRKTWKLYAQNTYRKMPKQLPSGEVIPMPGTVEEALRAALRLYETTRYVWEPTSDEVFTLHLFPAQLRAVINEMYGDRVKMPVGTAAENH